MCGMERLTIQVGSYGVNCSIVSDRGRAWIVDPGQEGERIVRLLAQKGLEPAAVLLTHAHFDHVCGIPALEKEFPDLPVYVGSGDMAMFGHPLNQFPPEYPSIPRPADLRDVDLLDLPWLKTIHTPGHTPGGVCYHIPGDGLLLSGDTLFAGSVGRTDFPGGSMATLVDSLKKLVVLPGETLVIPGHGPHTTIAAEIAGNPFL